jgi:hypothetical protein
MVNIYLKKYRKNHRPVPLDTKMQVGINIYGWVSSWVKGLL